MNNETVESYLKALGISGDEFYAEEVVSERYGNSKATLRNWRAQGKGPRYVKIGARVAYRGRDLAEFLVKSTVSPAARRGA